MIDFAYFRRRAFWMLLFIAVFSLGALRYMWGCFP